MVVEFTQLSNMLQLEMYSIFFNLTHKGDGTMKDFLSSFLFITSLLIFAISAYLLYWAIIMPLWAFIPFCLVLSAGLLCFYCSKKLDIRGNSR